MKLAEICEELTYTCLQGEMEKEISDIIYDSRKVEKDTIFVCMVGAVVDGHDFVEDAVKKGAAALVVEHAVEIDIPENCTVLQVEDAPNTGLRPVIAAHHSPFLHRLQLEAGGHGQGALHLAQLLEIGLEVQPHITVGIVGVKEIHPVAGGVLLSAVKQGSSLFKVQQRQPVLRRFSAAVWHVSNHVSKNV